MTDIQLILAISAAVTMTAGIPAIWLLAKKQRKQAEQIAFQSVRAAHDALEAPKVVEAVASSEARIAFAIETAQLRQAEALTEALEELRQIRSEVEWLSGERMIDQAVNLARDGLEPSIISKETGLSLDDAATISRFRRH